MKTYKVTMTYTGLAGQYTSVIEVKAKNEKSAEKKAYVYVGDRTLVSMKVAVS